jgi:hypothetical protein
VNSGTCLQQCNVRKNLGVLYRDQYEHSKVKGSMFGGMRINMGAGGEQVGGD